VATTVTPQQELGLRTVGHFIDGRFVYEAEETFETLNPATNEPIARVTRGTPEDLQRAIDAARKAFDEGPWPRMRAAERAKILRKVGDLITERAPEIAKIETTDTGLPIAQTGGAQIPRAADNFSFFAEMANHMDGAAYHSADYLNYTIQKPAGVAGLITPWNLPFMLTSWKVAPCLASGCTCVVKPASWTPLSNEKLAECIRDAGVPDGVFNLVYGSGETIGMGLVRSPEVQLISFTGETVTGRTIMREGAATMKRYSMELGGKSPIVVFADADYDRALDAAVFGVYSLNGERCTASSRCIVERKVYDRFVADLTARVNNIRVGDPMDKRTEIGALIHPSHLETVLNYVAIGRAEGAKLVAGGGRVPGMDKGNYMQPTLFADVDNDMRIAQEEVFGPVLVVIPFDTEEEAVRIASDVKYGLAGYVWTQDVAKANRVAQGIQCGMVWVNSQNVRDLRTPFGGAKESGIGREGGHYSWEFYCEMKNIAIALGHHHIPKFGAAH
jgi:5-carboxymethyl-2-hydroxymuconic-semialdehyde dehydrogenase